MNLDQLMSKLLRAARAEPPSGDAPYAFEKRIMARLRDLNLPDPWSLWARQLWRAATPCFAVMLALSLWTFVSPNLEATRASLAADLETTVMVPPNLWEDSW
jgi:hypothetical protein